MEERKIGIGGVILVGLLTALIGICILSIRSNISNSEHQHSWIVQNLDGVEVTFCEECGEQKIYSEHTHSWKAQKLDEKIIIVCEECGKTAEN